MKVKTFAILLMLACLAACESGDININPSTADNSTDNSVTNSNNTTAAPVVEENPCASYTNSGGAKIQGEFSGANCVYSKNFADAGAKPIVVDLYIPALENGGVHIFEGGLFIGKDYGTDAELAAAGGLPPVGLTLTGLNLRPPQMPLGSYHSSGCGAESDCRTSLCSRRYRHEPFHGSCRSAF